MAFVLVFFLCALCVKLHLDLILNSILDGFYMMVKAFLFRTAKLNALLLCLLLGFNTAKAQYVLIPDSVFALLLYNGGFSPAMHGDSLDTASNLVLTLPYLNTSYMHISSLEGVQYFKGLDSLKCNSDTTLIYLPSLPKGLRVLECRNDSLVSLPALPDSLVRLVCEFNVLDSLPALPATLRSITCYNNNLTHLPKLPDSLNALYCSGNQIDSLPALPGSLTVLSCYSNKLSALPSPLPSLLVNLLCSDNLLSSLPALPASLTDLDCYSNKLTVLPALPDSLQSLSCGYNKLATLPTLPNSLTFINAQFNNLNSLPALPDSLFQLFIDNNPGLKCLPLLNTIVDFEFFNTGIVCWPNLGNVYVSDPDTLNVCDSTNNTYGCLQINGVKEISKPVIGIYPNPAKNFFNITIEQSTIGGTLRIIDAGGKQVLASKLQMLNSNIETRNLAAGQYLIMVNDPQGRIAVSKLVIQ